MFTWLKKLLGIEPAASKPLVLEQPVVEPVKESAPSVEVTTKTATKAKATKPKKEATKKTSKKGTGKCDFDKLTKTQLLAEAKHRGVKANASLSKAEILERLKNA